MSDDDWEPTQASLREGEVPDLDSHARRNLEQIRIGVREGVIDEEVLEVIEADLTDPATDSP